MNIEELKSLKNEELLEIYDLFVKTNHYDPHATPELIVLLRENEISIDDIKAIVIDRMS